MKVSGFVLDTSEAHDKAVRWAREGKLERVYVQVEAWPHAEKNRRAFGFWKETLNPLGCAVYATLWGSEFDDVPNRIEELRLNLGPDGWCLNFEKPFAEGVDMKAIMKATKPEPVVVSFNGMAEQGGYDFRRYSVRGAEVHGQAYDPNGNSLLGPTPVEIVTSLWAPRIFWQGAPGTCAWWYRVKRDKSWSWRTVNGPVEGPHQSRLMIAQGTTPVLCDTLQLSDHLEFAPSRIVRLSPAGAQRGNVYGFAQYNKIGYSIGTTRPITPFQIAELAKVAAAPGMPVVKKADLYTLENTTDEQIAALCGAA